MKRVGFKRIKRRHSSGHTGRAVGVETELPGSRLTAAVPGGYRLDDTVVFALPSKEVLLS
jgi:hypothetical protein